MAFAQPFVIEPGKNGKLIAVGGVVDANTRTVPAIFEFANPERPAPGHDGQGQLMPARAGIGADARQRGAGRKRHVRWSMCRPAAKASSAASCAPGARDGERIAILDGIEPGQRVVSKGAYLIRLSTSPRRPPSATRTEGRIMIGYIIQWSLRNRLFVVVGALLLLVWGGIETARTPVDVFPDLTAPTVTVVTEAEGMAPADMEALVTFPIETALNGAPGVRRVRSATKIGLSVITVEFAWGTDGYLARQVVAEKLQLARPRCRPASRRR
jgi:hypothetical protein